MSKAGPPALLTQPNVHLGTHNNEGMMDGSSPAKMEPGSAKKSALLSRFQQAAEKVAAMSPASSPAQGSNSLHEAFRSVAQATLGPSVGGVPEFNGSAGIF